MKYALIVAEFYSRTWALRHETLFAMKELIRLQAFHGVKFSDEEIEQRIAEANKESGYAARSGREFRYLAIDPAHAQVRAAGSRAGNGPSTVAVIPMTGIISHRMGMMSDISGPGGTSTQKLTGQFREALADGNCRAIVLDVDSPGGSVEGVMELASEIFAARKQKPIVAVCNAMAASAAYWLASAAAELVCTPSGQAGSIGVYVAHQDESEAMKAEGVKISLVSAGKYKTEGNPTEPLSDEARASLQKKVEDIYGMFVKDVARNRNTTQGRVREGYGEGRMLLAQAAVKENLVDRVATLDDILEEYGVGGAGKKNAGAKAQSQPLAITEVPEPVALVQPLHQSAASGQAPEENDAGCECECPECVNNNCAECSNSNCSDPNCEHAASAGAFDPAVNARRRRELQLL